MKKPKLLLISLIFLLGCLNGFGGTSEIPSEVINALNKGDAVKLSSFLNDNVELVIENKNDIFSK